MLASRQGLADLDPHLVGEQVTACWDEFLDVVTAPATDLSRRSRLPGWTGRDVLVHLGAWPDNAPITGLVASARAGDGGGDVPHPDVRNAALLRAHADASGDEIVAALVRARDSTAAFFDGPDVALAREPARSTVGPLPVLCLVHAATYELAVHALDLQPCGAPPPAPHLLDRGLAALIDITGALSARSDVQITLTAAAPDTGWRYSSGPDGWTTEHTGGGAFRGTGVRGTVADLLDTSAGRTNLAQLLLTRRLVVQDLSSFMRLAPLVDAVPGLPGGPALQRAIAGLGRVTRLLQRG